MGLRRRHRCSRSACIKFHHARVRVRARAGLVRRRCVAGKPTVWCARRRRSPTVRSTPAATTATSTRSTRRTARLAGNTTPAGCHVARRRERRPCVRSNAVRKNRRRRRRERNAPLATTNRPRCAARMGLRRAAIFGPHRPRSPATCWRSGSGDGNDCTHSRCGDRSDGTAWGVNAAGSAIGRPDPRTVTTVLALDEDGLAAAWVKNFGGAPGTGFVRIPAYAGFDGTPLNLANVQFAAEYMPAR